MKLAPNQKPRWNVESVRLSKTKHDRDEVKRDLKKANKVALAARRRALRDGILAKHWRSTGIYFGEARLISWNITTKPLGRVLAMSEQAARDIFERRASEEGLKILDPSDITIRTYREPEGVL